MKVVLQDQSIFHAIGGKPYRMGSYDISGQCFNTGWSCSLEDVIRQVSPTGPFNPLAIISNILALFGDGLRVCIEVTLMTANSGVLPLDTDCIAIQRRIDGASNMPDAAMVLRPTRTQDIIQRAIQDKGPIIGARAKGPLVQQWPIVGCVNLRQAQPSNR